MIYIAIELDRPLLALVCEAIRDKIDALNEAARDVEAEENRRPDPTKLRLDPNVLHVKGERQTLYRGQADRLREFLMGQLAS